MYLLSLLLIASLSPAAVVLNSAISQPNHAIVADGPEWPSVKVADGPEWPSVKVADGPEWPSVKVVHDPEYPLVYS